MDRNKVKGYGSFLIKFIVNKIKFDLILGFVFLFNLVIDSILGLLFNERGNELFSNFLLFFLIISGVVLNIGSL